MTFSLPLPSPSPSRRRCLSFLLWDVREIKAEFRAPKERARNTTIKVPLMREMLVLGMTSFATVRTLHVCQCDLSQGVYVVVCANIIAFYGLFEMIFHGKFSAKGWKKSQGNAFKQF